MPRTTSVYQVFVASPADVTNERRILEEVIRELNQVWSQSIGISFELLKWETNVRPSFSSDAQAVINEQIGLEYDVFVGIFWGRIGTPTLSAESGTLEEFERAYTKFKSNNSSPEIMIYFKDAGIAPSKIDSEQLQKVSDFKKSLADKGGLYFIFEDEREFESSLRSHLSSLVQKLSTQASNKAVSLNAPSQVIASDTSLLSEEDDYGYLDYVEIYTTRLDEVTICMDAIGEATIRIGDQLNQRAQELKTIDRNNQKEFRRNAKRAADDLNSYAEVIKPQISVMATSREFAFDALSQALSLYKDFGTTHDDLYTLKGSIKILAEVASDTTIKTSQMRSAVNGLPRITKELNFAKRAVTGQLDLIVIEYEKISSTLGNISKAIDRMLEIGRAHV